MKIFKLFSILALVVSVSAQAQFGAPENSADVLAALKEVNDATVKSSRAAAAYQPNDQRSTRRLTRLNIFLRADWQAVLFTAQSAAGFYSDEGAQAIIDYINTTLYPNTRDADQIYVNKRDVFVQGGFIDFINPGLLQLREAVDSASAAVQSKTRANRLTPMTVAFTQIEQDYATTQEIQQFGPQ